MNPVIAHHALTPNEMAAVARAVAGWRPPRPLTQEEFIRLLPIEYRVINDQGITWEKRTYDSVVINHLRNVESPVMREKGKWPIFVNSYDISQVWVDDVTAGALIEVPCRELANLQAPVGARLHRMAVRKLREGTGRDLVTEAEILAVADSIRRSPSTSDESRTVAREEASRASRRELPTPKAPESPTYPMDEPGPAPTPPATFATDEELPLAPPVELQAHQIADAEGQE